MKQPKCPADREDRLNRGTVVTILYLKGFSEIFKRIVSKDEVGAAFRLCRKIEVLKPTARKPLGEKKRISPCKCKKIIDIGKIYRIFGTRKKEHEAKIRLTKRNIENGNIESVKTMS